MSQQESERATRQRNSWPTHAQAERVFTCVDHNDEELGRPVGNGYLAHHEWADKMLLTHVQLPCSECHLWRIWVPA